MKNPFGLGTKSVDKRIFLDLLDIPSSTDRNTFLKFSQDHDNIVVTVRMTLREFSRIMHARSTGSHTSFFTLSIGTWVTKMCWHVCLLRELRVTCV